MEMIPYIHESQSVINLRNLFNLVVMKEAALKPPPPCVKDGLDGSRSGYRNISVMTQMNMTPVISEFGMKVVCVWGGTSDPWLNSLKLVKSFHGILLILLAFFSGKCQGLDR